MKILLVGAPDSNVPLHVMTVVRNVVQKGSGNPSRSNRLYFLDHRNDNRESMSKYIFSEGSDLDLDISYKVSTCSSVIMTELIDDLMIETRQSDRQTRVILYFNLDSITSSNPNILVHLFQNLDMISEKLPLDIICLSTRRVLNNILLEQFDRIDVFKDTSPSSVAGLIKYITDTNRYHDIDRLQYLIASLDTDSESSVTLSELVNISNKEAVKIGRLIIV